MQNLDRNVTITNADGTPTDFFMRILQDRGIGQDSNTTLLTKLSGSKITGSLGITVTGTGYLKDGNVALSGDVQGMLNQITTTRGSIIYRGATGWSYLAPGTSGNFLQTAGAGADPVWAAVTSVVGYVPTTRLVNTGTGLTGGGDLSADRTISLANTTVTAGSYTLASITVDAQGRITAASSGSITGYVPTTRQVIAGAGLTGGGDLSADRTFALTTTGVTAGTYAYANVTVDAYGRITSITAGAAPTNYIYAPCVRGGTISPLPIYMPDSSYVMVRIA